MKMLSKLLQALPSLTSCALRHYFHLNRNHNLTALVGAFDPEQ
jgi:hypothetical protein